MRRLLAMLALGAVIAFVPALRRPVLQAAGRALVVEDPLVPADVIVLASDSPGAGPLEVADLVHRGVAARVAVLAFLEDPAVEREYLRRGVPYEDAAAKAVRQLRALGVATVEVIPTRVTGTEDQGRVLPPWCDQHGFRSIVVVAEADHSRRVRRVLHRAMRGHMTAVRVRVSRYSQFDPDGWWETRVGTRAGLVELQKLLLDFLRHPFS